MKIFKLFALAYIISVLSACSTMPVTQQTTPAADEVVQPSRKTGIESKSPPKSEVITPPKVDKPIIDSAAQAPPAVIALLDRAKKQLSAGDIVAANASLERAIRIAPRYPESYYRLALLRFQEKNYSQARALAQKTISLGAQGSLHKQALALIERVAGQ